MANSKFNSIVFVHGIQGHPQKTWQTTIAPLTKPRNRLQRLFQPSKNEDGASPNNNNTTSINTVCSEGAIFWPRDLLSEDCPEARILTYGYDSRVSNFFHGPASQNNIAAHGRSLLHGLELERRDNPKRKIIFIAHSLGGIVLKEALRRSRDANNDDQDLRNIHESTYATIFLGTRHRGSSYAELGLVAQRLVKVVGFDASDELLRNLKPDGSYIELLREEFSKMLEARSFKVYSFQEGMGYKGVQGLSRKVVDDASSSLDHPSERRDFINANHITMCRFSSREDDGYIKVRGVILKYVGDIRKQKDAFHGHKLAGFQGWLESNAGLFWIKGKPASGKSTLMKYILADDRTRNILSRQQQPVLSISCFFFHDRGLHAMQKSLEGLMRSVLYQLLRDIPGLTPIVGDIYRRCILDRDDQNIWLADELDEALKAILEQKKIQGCAYLFIDALDEYSGDKAWITQFLKKLATPDPDQVLTLRICASSRDWNVFGLLLSESPHLVLHEWTMPDIRRFASERLEEAKRDGSERLLEEITNRAEGIFLWVRLVIDELMGPLFDGESIQSLLGLVCDMPDELPEFYERIMSKVSRRNKATSLAMIEMTLASKYKPINLEDFALAVNLDPKGVLPEDYEFSPSERKTRRDEIVRRVKACSGGLLEVVGHEENAYVEFTHQTVFSFFTTNRELLGDRSAEDLVCDGLERMLKLICCAVRHRTSRFRSGSDRVVDQPEFYCAQVRDQLMTEFLELSWTMQLFYKTPSPEVVDDILNDLEQFFGPRRIRGYWGANDVDRYQDRHVLKDLQPVSFLDLIVLNGLTLLAEREIATRSQRYSTTTTSLNGTKILYYALLGIMDIHPDPSYFRDGEPGTKRHLTPVDDVFWYRLIESSLQQGLDSDGILMLRVCQDNTLGPIKDITLLHYASFLAGSSTSSDFLDTVRTIMNDVEQAAQRYNLFWEMTIGWCYFLHPHWGHTDPLEDKGLGRTITRSALQIVGLGLSPNARYRRGPSVFEVAVLTCPYMIVRDMLFRGAQITPRLITDIGTPVAGPNGILHKPKWRKAEVYTPEARSLVVQRNPDWKDWFEVGIGQSYIFDG
ncbi:hypothetical protein FDECE_8035 [Fusarium decemcellulare]|nr:hypothetical protein FDECE_8035 [Fusarium decemcellulare]